MSDSYAAMLRNTLLGLSLAAVSAGKFLVNFLIGGLVVSAIVCGLTYLASGGIRIAPRLEMDVSRDAAEAQTNEWVDRTLLPALARAEG